MLAVFVGGILLVTSVEVEAKFSSFHCEVIDKDFGEFPICTIKEINRFRNSINFLYRQKQAAKKVTVRFEVFKKSVGFWRPFIYNITIDLCEFLGKENNAVMKLAFKNLKPYLTLKNSCPFKPNDTVKCENLEMDFQKITSRFPLESGEYGLQVSYFQQKILRLSINGSAKFIKNGDK